MHNSWFFKISFEVSK